MGGFVDPPPPPLHAIALPWAPPPPPPPYILELMGEGDGLSSVDDVSQQD